MNDKSEFTSFFKYCETRNIKLLEGDRKFLIQCLDDAEAYQKRQALYEYSKVWEKAYHEEQTPRLRDHLGRYAANIWMRENYGS